MDLSTDERYLAHSIHGTHTVTNSFIRPLCLRDDVVDARSFGSLNVLDTL